jgi:dTDP-glucose 4,6-dehydratase
LLAGILPTKCRGRNSSRRPGGRPEIGFDQGLARTIAWYRENMPWLDDVRTGQYRDYFQKHYVQREKTFAP